MVLVAKCCSHNRSPAPIPGSCRPLSSQGHWLDPTLHSQPCPSRAAAMKLNVARTPCRGPSSLCKLVTTCDALLLPPSLMLLPPVQPPYHLHSQQGPHQGLLHSSLPRGVAQARGVSQQHLLPWRGHTPAEVGGRDFSWPRDVERGPLSVSGTDSCRAGVESGSHHGCDAEPQALRGHVTWDCLKGWYCRYSLFCEPNKHCGTDFRATLGRKTERRQNGGGGVGRGSGQEPEARPGGCAAGWQQTPGLLGLASQGPRGQGTVLPWARAHRHLVRDPPAPLAPCSCPWSSALHQHVRPVAWAAAEP